MEDRELEKETNDKTAGPWGPRQYPEIEISKILTSGQMVRTAQDDDHITELAMSIITHGLLNPISVKPLPDGFYQLQAGFHRLQAYIRLNKKTIPALIREEDTGSTKTIAFVENLIRRDMSLQEESIAVAYLYNEEKRSISSICDLLCKSTSWVQKRLMLPNLPEDVKNELFDGKISVGHAEIIAKIEDPGTRATILNTILQQRLTVRQTEDLANLYQNSPTIGLSIVAGQEKALEIQTQERTPKRTCDVCHASTDLSQTTLIGLCPDCVNWLKEQIEETIKKGENHA